MRLNADRVKRLREERGWSQEHLAAVSGLSARTIQRLEAEGKASHESRMAVAAAFGVEAASLNATHEDAAIGGQSAIQLPAWIDAKAVRWILGAFAFWFIYQAGRAAGEAWYYFTH